MLIPKTFPNLEFGNLLGTPPPRCKLFIINKLIRRDAAKTMEGDVHLYSVQFSEGVVYRED